MVPGSVGPVGLVLVALGVLTVEAAINGLTKLK